MADCASQVFHVKNTSTWISCNIHFTRYFVNFFTWYPSVLNFTTFFHMHFTWNSFYVNFKRNSCKAKFLWTWIGYGCKLCHQQALSTLLNNYDKEKKKPINFHIHFVLEKEPILRCTLEQVIFAGCYFLYILTKSPMFETCILFEIAGRQ